MIHWRACKWSLLSLVQCTCLKVATSGRGIQEAHRHVIISWCVTAGIEIWFLICIIRWEGFCFFLFFVLVVCRATVASHSDRQNQKICVYQMAMRVSIGPHCYGSAFDFSRAKRIFKKLVNFASWFFEMLVYVFHSFARTYMFIIIDRSKDLIYGAVTDYIR